MQIDLNDFAFEYSENGLSSRYSAFKRTRKSMLVPVNGAGFNCPTKWT